MEKIRTTAELYAHALAMEEEAAHRYVDFALRMLDEGSTGLAELFWKLGRAEGAHYAALLRKAGEQGIVLPRVDAGVHRWIASETEAAPRDFVLRLMTPRQALAIALDAERRARDFFHSVAGAAPDAGVRALAREMAAEEDEHIALLLREIERVPAAPATATEWDRLFIEAAA
jgi:rubrerythrin